MSKDFDFRRGTLYTYSGQISFPAGAPNLMDIAISLSRECRYAGNGMRWWPVTLHTFCVCDMLPDKLKLHGLLHDSPECITGDAPKPTKTDAFEALEDKLLAAIYKSFGLTLPTPTEHRIIKRADDAVLDGEIYTVGTRALQAVHQRNPKAEELVMKYLTEYPPMECITPDGRAPIEFMRRFRVYSDMLKAE